MGILWKIHLRNMSAPILAADFRGILIADHVPQMVGDRRTGWPYTIGYIKALCDMAREQRRS